VFTGTGDGCDTRRRAPRASRPADDRRVLGGAA